MHTNAPVSQQEFKFPSVPTLVNATPIPNGEEITGYLSVQTDPGVQITAVTKESSSSKTRTIDVSQTEQVSNSTNVFRLKSGELTASQGDAVDFGGVHLWNQSNDVIEPAGLFATYPARPQGPLRLAA